MKYYRYLYYNLYLIWQKKKGEKDIAHMNAVITITFFFFLNLTSIPLLYMAIFRKGITLLPEELNSNAKSIIVIFILLVGFLNYFYLGRKKKREGIIEQFNKQSDNKRKRGIMFAVLYLLISASIPLYIFFFTKPL